MLCCARELAQPPPTWVISECSSSGEMFVRLMTQHTSRLVNQRIWSKLIFWWTSDIFNPDLTSKLQDLVWKNYSLTMRLSLGQLRVSSCFFVVLTPNKIVPLTFHTGNFGEKNLYFCEAMLWPLKLQIKISSFHHWQAGQTIHQFAWSKWWSLVEIFYIRRSG